MDQFRTPVRVQPGAPISHATKLFTTGSCFADLLGAKLRESRFHAAINPFGVSYNPISIHKSMSMALNKERPAPELYAQSEGSFRHMDFHSTFRAKTLNLLASVLQQSLSDAAAQLHEANAVVMTYGTSWVYKHKTSGKPVNNCQKLPANEFDRYLLDPSDVVASFESLYKLIKGSSPSTRFILTVSPVRHLKDSLDMNQLSKAGLIIACHRIVQKLKDVDYFPAYEIMIDDLRDYRFYEPDMIHPSSVAVDYIWEKFGQRYFNADTASIASKCQELSRALAHRPFDPTSNEHTAFLVRTLALAKDLQGKAAVADDVLALEKMLAGQGQLS